MRTGGRLRFDYGYDQTFRRDQDGFGMMTRATVGIETVAPSPWGELRSTIRTTWRRSGRDQSPGVELEEASVEWAGFTAGQANSFFDRHMARGPLTLVGGGVNGRGSDLGPTMLIGYEARLLRLFPVTVSLEDPAARNAGVIGAWTLPPRTPDLVFTAMGATRRRERKLAVVIKQVGADSPGVKRILGHAVQFTEDRRLGVFWGWTTILRWQATAAIAASAYSGWSYGAIGVARVLTGDAILTKGRLYPVRSWSTSLGLIQRWSPELQTNLFAIHGRRDIPGVARGMMIRTLGLNTTWRPSPRAEVAVEVTQSRLMRQPGFLPAPLGALPRGEWSGRIRVQQDF